MQVLARIIIMCGSRKYSYSAQGQSLEKGSPKIKVFKEKYDTKLGFPEGCGVRAKNIQWRVIDIFWNNKLIITGVENYFFKAVSYKV